MGKTFDVNALTILDRNVSVSLPVKLPLPKPRGVHLPIGVFHGGLVPVVPR